MKTVNLYAIYPYGQACVNVYQGETHGVTDICRLVIYVEKHHFIPPFFRMSAGKRQKEDLF